MSVFLFRPRTTATSARLRRTVAVAAVSSAVAIASAMTSSAAAATPTTTTNPAAAAAGWLAQQFSNAQNKRVPSGDHIELKYNDGTQDVYFFDGGGTADATFALAASKSGGDKIKTAINYLGAHIDDYAGYSDPDYGPYYGSIGKAALAAIVDGKNPNNFGGHHLLTDLKTDECATGSTSCTPGSNDNVYSSVATSFIVLAEARGAKTAGSSYAPSANLVNFLLSEQCGNGGFSSDIPAGSGSSCSADVDATGYAVMALQAVGGHQSQITAAGNYLVSTRGSNGAWSSDGTDNIDSTGLGAAALEIAGRSAASSRTWLASQQVTTGPTIGTGSSRGALKYNGAYDAFSSIKGTSDAMFGLVKGASLATVSAASATAGTAVLALAAPTVQHSSVKAGGSQTVTGTGFGGGEKITGVLDAAKSTKTTVGTVTAKSTGTATLTFKVPASLAAGKHTITITGAVSKLSSSTTFTVTAVPSSSVVTVSTHTAASHDSNSTLALADTGRDGRQTRTELVLAVALIAAGSVATLLGHRGSARRR